MATYKEIQGTAVQSLASNTGTETGQIWYDTANNLFKVEVIQTEAWATGANFPGSNMGFAGFGTQTAYVKAAGNSGSPAPNPVGNDVYEFDGTSWTTGNTIPQATRDPDGAGTQTQGIVFGGQKNSPEPQRSQSSFTYDGTNWTSTPDMNNRRRSVTGSGEQTTAITAGGAGEAGGSPEAPMSNTESYNGSSWVNETALPSPKSGGGQFGPETGLLRFGGGPGTQTATLEYAVNAWTSGGSLNTTREGSIGGAGTLTLGLVFGGGPGANVATESYDGTCFTSGTNLSTGGARRGSKVGTTSDAISVGPTPPGGPKSTELYTPGGFVTKTLTTS